MRDAVLIEGIALEGSGPFEKNDVIVAAAKSIELLRDVMNRKRIGMIRIAADAAEILHAEDVDVEVLGTIQIIHGYAEVVGFVSFMRFSLPIFSGRDCQPNPTSLSRRRAVLDLIPEMVLPMIREHGANLF